MKHDVINDLWKILPEKSFHAVICDPPYSLESITKRFGNGQAGAKFAKDVSFQRLSKGFMGQTWDNDVAFRPETWYNIMQIMLPGAIGMAFSSTRTFHRLATAIENAGFIIHSSIAWIQSQGFPKGKNVYKELLKRGDQDAKSFYGYSYGIASLSPSFEPICVFQKPFKGSQLSVAREYGTGLYNIKDARFGSRKVTINSFTNGAKPFGNAVGEDYETKISEGMFPKNVIFDQAPEEINDYFLSIDNYVYHKKAVGKKDKHFGLKYKNPHPTVKPIGLITYLAKLLLPPDLFYPRRVLVPFCGSGSEMIGCLFAGWDEVYGFDNHDEYLDVAKERLEYAEKVCV